MSFLGELGSINAVLKSATGLMREIKRPRLKSDDFARILEAQVQQTTAAKNAATTNAARPESVLEKSARLTSHYLQLHDADRDGSLTLTESGLEATAFAQIDVDGDGQLNSAELQAAAATRMLTRYQP